MEATADLTTATPVEIDTELAALYEQIARYSQSIRSAIKTCHYALDDKVRRVIGQTKLWVRDDADVETEARARHAAGTIPRAYAGSISSALAHLDTDRVARAELAARYDTLEAEYARRRWTRFFIVEQGHIHSSMGCSTCYPTTRFGWLPTLSGQSEAAAVAEHGALLCTICYPSAPVEWTNGREAAAAAKAAANCSGHRDYDAPSRTGYYRGNWATCTCGARVTLTSTGKLRAHKPAQSPTS